MSIGNDVVSSDFLKVLLALKDNIMKDLHCNDIGIVVSTSENECVCKLLSNPDIKISCAKINDIITDKDDVVFIAYTDVNSKHNAKQLSNQKDLRNQTIGNKHAYENAVIVLNYSKQGSGEGVTVDSSFSTTSTNALQNRVITNRFNQVESRLLNVDNSMSNTSINPVQNKVLYNPVEFAEMERQKSKNLLRIIKDYSRTASVSDGLLTIDKDTQLITITGPEGTGGWLSNINIIEPVTLKANTTYTLSVQHFDNSTIVGTAYRVFYLHFDDPDKQWQTINIYNNNAVTFTPSKDLLLDSITFDLARTNIYTNASFKVQLEQNNTMSDWQYPYGAIIHKEDIFGTSALTLLYSKNTTDPNLNKGKTNGILETSGSVSIDFNEYDFALCKIRSDSANHDYTASLFMIIPLKDGVGAGYNYTGCISVENPYNVIRRNTVTINVVSVFATIPTTKDSISIFTTAHVEGQLPAAYSNVAIDDIWGIKLL